MSVEGNGGAEKPRGRRRLPAAVMALVLVGGLGVALGRRLDPTRRAGSVPWCDPDVPAGVVGAAVPSFVALDQDGRTVTNQDFHGIPWIADFIFTSCTASCPVLTGRLIALQRQLSGAPVRFVSFSVDTENDTPPVMKDYAARWHGDPARWRLLSTDRNTLARLGPALGGAEQPGTAAPFHSDRFALVDGGGRLLGLYSSASAAELHRLQRDLQEALPRTRRAPGDRTIGQSALASGSVRSAGAGMP